MSQPMHPPTDFRTDPKQLGTFLWILYGNMFFATILYAVVLYMIDERDSEPLHDMILNLLYMIAGGTSLAVLFIRFRKIPTLILPGPAGVIPAPEDSLALTAKIRFWHILMYVLIETVCIYGFLVGYLANEFEPAIPFFGSGYILFILCYPQVPWRPSDPMSGPIG